MIDDVERGRMEKVEADLNALVNRRQAERVRAGEISFDKLLDRRERQQREERHRENVEQWRLYHERRAENMRAEAARQLEKAARLAELVEERGA